MNRFTRRPRWLLLTVLATLAIALAACGSAGSGDEAGGEDFSGRDVTGVTDADDGGEQGAPEAPAEGEGGGTGAAPPLGAPVEQRIVKTGEITVEVPNVGTAVGEVRAIVLELGGYVGGSQAGSGDERATLTIRVPAARFDEALSRIHDLEGGEVIVEATREQDVTGQVVDLEARIDNLRASEASYRELVNRAERVEDILAVQSRLDEVRGQIEQLQAQLDVLESQADLSTLTVSLVPRAEPIAQTTETWNPGEQLDRALASLVGIGQALLDGLIWFVVVWLPVLLVLGLLVLVALRGVLEVRRRLPPTGHVATAPAGRDDGAA
jgi:hypothetical protein